MSTDVLPGTLEAEETAIRGGFVEMASAMERIRSGRLYRQAGYTDFDSYSIERLGMSRRQADRVIDARRIVQDLGPIGLTLNESQARALAPIRDDPEAMARVTRSVNDDATENGRRIRAKDITEAVARHQRLAELEGSIERGLTSGRDAARDFRSRLEWDIGRARATLDEHWCTPELREELERSIEYAEVNLVPEIDDDTWLLDKWCHSTETLGLAIVRTMDDPDWWTQGPGTLEDKGHVARLIAESCGLDREGRERFDGCMELHELIVYRLKQWSDPDRRVTGV